MKDKFFVIREKKILPELGKEFEEIVSEESKEDLREQKIHSNDSEFFKYIPSLDNPLVYDRLSNDFRIGNRFVLI